MCKEIDLDSIRKRVYDESEEFFDGVDLTEDEKSIIIENAVQQLVDGKAPKKKKDKVRLVRLNWDDEYDKDIRSKHGFDVTEPPFTKEKKNMNGLHSPRFATDWDDEESFQERYRCKCKDKPITGRLHEGEICPKCNSPVEYKDVDLSLTAWINIDNYYIIQPIYYHMLSSFIGKKIFPQIIQYDPEITLNGQLTKKQLNKNPFIGIGMVEFYDRFEEIIHFFKKKHKNKPNKKEMADIFLNEKKSVFAKHIPVFSSVLRSVSFKGDSFVFSKIDTKFNTIYSQTVLLNNNDKLLKKVEAMRLKGNNEGVQSLEIPNMLYNIQTRLMAAWKMIFDQVTTKNGHIRDQILGGRVDYSGRSVIRPDPTLRADEISVCYLSFLEVYKYEIRLLLSKLNNISMSKADDIINYAKLEFDPSVYAVMNYIISTGHNLCDLNRNPTLFTRGRCVCEYTL